MAIASNLLSNGTRQETGPRIFSRAILMRLSTFCSRDANGPTSGSSGPRPTDWRHIGVEFLVKGFHDRALHDVARAGEAHLPGIAHKHAGCAFGRSISVSIVEDDERRLATQLKADGHHALRAPSRADCAAGTT